MSAREDQLLDQRHKEVLEAITGVHERLDLLNGRTRKNENDIAVMKWTIGGITTGITGFVTWLLKG